MAHPHGPSAYRALLRRLKDRHADPRALLREATQIPDPGYAAQGLAAVATTPALPERVAEEALVLARERLEEVKREVNRAEAVAEILRHIATSGRSTERGDPFIANLVALLDGEALSKGLRAAAKHASTAQRHMLFDRALSNRGSEREDAKAILRLDLRTKDDLGSADVWERRIAAIEDHGLRAPLAAFLHQEVAALDADHPVAERAMQTAVAALVGAPHEPDVRARVDAWRTVVQSAGNLRAIDQVWEATADEDAVVQADVLLALGAQADRLGDKERAARAFDAAAAATERLDERDRERVTRKLDAARARLAGAVPAKRDAAPSKEQVVHVKAPPQQATRHALALYNTYTGGLATPHLRTLARAAPLCVAFDLDLVLMGWPFNYLDEMVTRAAAETRIGGRAFLAELAEAGRVRVIPEDPATDPSAWGSCGRLVATSERPEPGSLVDLEKTAKKGPICLIMGIGPKGLPHRVRSAAYGEYEITGQGIGLETATAMGILADRLGRL